MPAASYRRTSRNFKPASQSAHLRSVVEEHAVVSCRPATHEAHALHFVVLRKLPAVQVLQTRTVVLEQAVVSSCPATHAAQALHFFVAASRKLPVVQSWHLRLLDAVQSLTSSWPAVHAVQPVQTPDLRNVLVPHLPQRRSVVAVHLSVARSPARQVEQTLQFLVALSK